MISLFKHQQLECNNFDKPVWAWFWETGTGKTIISIEYIKYLYEHKKINAAIIAAPKTILRSVWLKALDQYYRDLDYFAFQWIGDFTDYQYKALDTVLKKEKDPDRLLLFFINIETFSYDRIYKILPYVMKRWFTLWIIDQSTTIKAVNTKRTKGILRISHLAEYKRILSGYPILKSPEDLYPQIQFLGIDLIPFSSFYAFRNEFCLTRKLDNRVTITIGTKNINKLQKLIKPFSSRVLKKDCFDLPPKLKTKRYVEMTPEQAKYYKQMKEEGYVTIKNTNEQSFASTLLVQLEKLHQIANGYILSLFQFISHNKTIILKEIIDDEIGENQFIIWSSYIASIQEIKYHLQDKYRCEMLYGETPITERNKIIEQFTQGKIQGLIANPAVAKYGLNLFMAHYAIYFNNSFKLEDRLESEDRLHRYGQFNPVTYIDLVTENTVEEKILETLEHNHSISASILGDKWEEWFK